MRKTVFFIFLGLLLTFAFSLLGEGTPKSPYIVTNCIDLQNMQNNLSANYALVNNIDCFSVTRSGGQLWNNGDGFTPIGSSQNPFIGKFDGKGFVINGIYSMGSVDDFGLFGYIKNAAIQNVGITNTFSVTGKINVGTIAGTSDASIVRNVYGKSMARGGTYYGGLIGRQINGAQLINSYNSGNIIITNYSQWIGGLVGSNESSSIIKNSFSSAGYSTLDVQKDYLFGSYVWGVAGKNSATITNSYWFDSSGKVTYCYQKANAGCVNAPNASSFFSQSYGVYAGSPAWDSNWVWSGSDYPSLKQNYFCYGSIDSNSEIYSGDDASIVSTDEREIILVNSNTSRKCEYHCKEGYYKNGNSCALYVCKDGAVSKLNSTMCSGDNFPLSADTNAVLVDSGKCTSKKCEWECGKNFFVSSDKNICEPYTCANIDPNSRICSGDDANLTQNVVSTLLDSNSLCTSEKKCEYYCKEGYYSKSQKCIPWACNGEMDSNALLYPSDNLNVTNKEELTNVLVDANTSRKCEWHCDSKFYRVNDTCLSYQCIGTIDTNSILCSGSNTNLDKNYPITIVDTYSNCSSSNKCQWYCRNGYYLKEGKCLPFSTLTCEGDAILNAVMCPDDDVFLTQKGIRNVLVDSNESCSESRKCQWYCMKGYYAGSGSDINKCLPFECTGETFENALLYYEDDLNLGSSFQNELVDSNTANKCEYHCRQGYHIEAQNGVKQCVANIYSCAGSFENATLFDFDEEGIDSNIESVLSKTNTSRKCEWHCDKGFVITDGKCVSLQKETAKCGDAAREYIMGEDFPGNDSLCSTGTGSLNSKTLDNILGSTLTWNCESDKSVECKATRVQTKEDKNAQFNSILQMFAEVSEDNNIIVSVKCTSEMKINLSASGFASGKEYDLSANQIDCNSTLVSHKIAVLSALEGETQLTVKTSINGTASTCHTCEMEANLDIKSASNEIQLNPLFIGGLILAIILVSVLINIFFGQENE